MQLCFSLALKGSELLICKKWNLYYISIAQKLTHPMDSELQVKGYHIEVQSAYNDLSVQSPQGVLWNTFFLFISLIGALQAYIALHLVKDKEDERKVSTLQHLGRSVVHGSFLLSFYGMYKHCLSRSRRHGIFLLCFFLYFTSIGFNSPYRRKTFQRTRFTGAGLRVGALGCSENKKKESSRARALRAGLLGGRGGSFCLCNNSHILFVPPLYIRRMIHG